jgi:3-methylcrotonyl-CoA carboxylase alpha subunit
MSTGPVVTRLGDGMYRVQHEGRSDLVYVAGPPADRWLFWNGRVYHRPFQEARDARRGSAAADARQTLTAPMPATVLDVLVAPGASVARGDTLVILEAMKMELPVRSAADARVVSVACRRGELVQPGAVLVELE